MTTTVIPLLVAFGTSRLDLCCGRIFFKEILMNVDIKRILPSGWDGFFVVSISNSPKRMIWGSSGPFHLVVQRYFGNTGLNEHSRSQFDDSFRGRIFRGCGPDAKFIGNRLSHGVRMVSVIKKKCRYQTSPLRLRSSKQIIFFNRGSTPPTNPCPAQRQYSADRGREFGIRKRRQSSGAMSDSSRVDAILETVFPRRENRFRWIEGISASIEQQQALQYIEKNRLICFNNRSASNATSK